MTHDSKIPRFVGHVVPEPDGFRPLVAHRHQFVYRGDVCPTLPDARQAIAEYVVDRPEHERAIVWAEDEPFWVAGEEVGRISVEPFSIGGCTYGWVRLTRETPDFAGLMSEGLEYSRQWETGPDPGTASDRCMAIGVALAEMGLAVGRPPRAIESLNVLGDWHMFLCLAVPWDADCEPGAAADGGSATALPGS